MADDWLPAQAPFEIVRRGFSPEQVVSHLESLEYELRIATANRDATLQRVTELTSQLSAAQAESDSLRHQLDRNTLEPYSVASLSDRMQRLIRLAEEEAAEIRAVAETESAELRERTERETSELLRTTGTELATEAARLEALEQEQRRALQQDVDLLTDERTAFAEERETIRVGMTEEVRTLVQQADDYSRDIRAGADEYARDTRAVADELAAATTADANERALAVTQDSHAAAEQLLLEAREAAATLQHTSTAESERIVGEANALAHEVTSNAVAEAQQLDERSTARRREVEEDFEITMTARRTDAQRVQADRERSSIDLAQARLDEAAERSATQLAQADEESRRLVQAATAEANRRVQEADAAVTSLTDLRHAITAQLGDLHGHVEHVRTLVASAPDLVVPPAQESRRITAATFSDDLERATTREIPAVTEDTRSEPATAAE